MSRKSSKSKSPRKIQAPAAMEPPAQALKVETVDLTSEQINEQNQKAKEDILKQEGKINSVFSKLDRIQLNLAQIGREYDKIKTANCLEATFQAPITVQNNESSQRLEEAQETGRSLETIGMLQESQSLFCLSA